MIYIKYFTIELLQKLNNPKTSDAADKLLNENAKKYYRSYLRTRKKLSFELIQVLEQVGGLHDARIVGINVAQSPTNMNVFVTLWRVLCDGSTVFRGTLEYKNVSVFKSSININSNCNYLGEYLNGEFYYKKNIFIHNFVFTEANEIYIECQEIRWNKTEMDTSEHGGRQG